MTPLNKNEITSAWHRIQGNVSSRLLSHQANCLNTCFDAVLDDDVLYVTAPRGQAEALNSFAAQPAGITAQRLDVAQRVVFVEPGDVDTAVGEDDDFDLETFTAPPPTPSPRPTRPLLSHEAGYDPWADVPRLLATVKTYQAQKRNGQNGATAVNEPIEPVTHHEQVVTSDSDTEKEQPPMSNQQTNTPSPVPLKWTTIWRATLGELELQLTKATFNTWLKDAKLGGWDEDTAVLTIFCRNDYAAYWLERLKTQVERTVMAIADRPLTVAFAVEPSTLKAFPPSTVGDVESVASEDAPTAVVPEYDDLRWPDPRKNFTMTPDHLFQAINPRTDITPSTKLLVQAILYHTLGNLDKEMRPSDWWLDVSQGDLCHAIGITPKTLRVAIREALLFRIIKRRKATKRHCFDYALRFAWEGGEWDEPLGCE